MQTDHGVDDLGVAYEGEYFFPREGDPEGQGGVIGGGHEPLVILHENHFVDGSAVDVEQRAGAFDLEIVAFGSVGG